MSWSLVWLASSFLVSCATDQAPNSLWIFAEGTKGDLARASFELPIGTVVDHWFYEKLVYRWNGDVITERISVLGTSKASWNFSDGECLLTVSGSKPDFEGVTFSTNEEVKSVPVRCVIRPGSLLSPDGSPIRGNLYVGSSGRWAAEVFASPSKKISALITGLRTVPCNFGDDQAANVRNCE